MYLQSKLLYPFSFVVLFTGMYRIFSLSLFLFRSLSLFLSLNLSLSLTFIEVLDDKASVRSDMTARSGFLRQDSFLEVGGGGGGENLKLR